MSATGKRSLAPVAWLAYLLIGIEILYMISPFALYYYGTYGPSLNFLHQWTATTWLTGFFLPHYAETSSWVLNSLQGLGGVLFIAGLVLFLVGAGQIYYAKFTGKGAVIAGFYRYVRNPQYTAFAIMGLGLVLVWPRFTVLIMYVAMLFVYYLLARKEEKECEEKFGDAFRVYVEKTPMFVPWRISVVDRLPSLPKAGIKRAAAGLLVFFGALSVSVLAGFWVREISVRQVSTFYAGNSATIATAPMDEGEIEKTLKIALGHSEVQNRLARAGYGTGEKFLNYVVPLDWFLPDLPLEVLPEGVHGHHQPGDFNRDEYKVLFTKAGLHTCSSAACDAVTGANIIKRTFKRTPVLVVKLNRATGEVLGVEMPPPHVRWGDIPTPLF